MYYCDKLVVFQLYDVSHLHIHPFLTYQSIMKEKEGEKSMMSSI